MWKPIKLGKAVVILGWDTTGAELTSAGLTSVVGADGCVLYTPEPLPFQGRVVLCCNNKEIEGFMKPCEPVLANVGPAKLDRYQYIVGFEQADETYWDVQLEVCETALQQAQIECRACQHCLAADLNGLEAMIYQAHAAIFRTCPCCRERTKFTAPHKGNTVYEAASQDPNLVVSGHEIYELRKPKKDINDRQHGRIPTHAKAFLRIPGRDEELVNVLDVSRGGLRFESPNNYEVGLEMEVALHYVEGGNNIFQKGRIVRKQRRPTETWNGEYGLMFIRAGANK